MSIHHYPLTHVMLLQRVIQMSHGTSKNGKNTVTIGCSFGQESPATVPRASTCLASASGLVCDGRPVYNVLKEVLEMAGLRVLFS